jgi:hypothetical protein
MDTVFEMLYSDIIIITIIILFYAPLAYYYIKKYIRDNDTWKDSYLEYKRDAEQGYPKSQLALGHCYERGLGVTKDYNLAIKWYRQAALQGNTEAPNELALLYKYGIGVEKDYIESYAWFILGDKDEYKNRVFEEILKILTHEQIEIGNRRSKEIQFKIEAIKEFNKLMSLNNNQTWGVSINVNEHDTNLSNPEVKNNAIIYKYQRIILWIYYIIYVTALTSLIEYKHLEFYRLFGIFGIGVFPSVIALISLKLVSVYHKPE